jgi:hypothetical protein
VDSDEETAVNSDNIELILVGVSGTGYCFLCGTEGLKYKLYEDIACEHTIIPLGK